jgi:pimeloyl-ACP methyl ester carboxylesterase
MTVRASANGWASLFWSAFDHSATPMALLRSDRVLIAVNHALVEDLGYQPDEAIGRRSDQSVREAGLLGPHQPYECDDRRRDPSIPAADRDHNIGVHFPGWAPSTERHFRQAHGPAASRVAMARGPDSYRGPLRLGETRRVTQPKARRSVSATDVSTDRVDAWWSEGEYVPLHVGGVECAIFVRRMGSGPLVTLLHGYPASSYQWAKVAPELAGRYTLLMPDFLGFGASPKPREHDYSLIEQADLVEALWAHDGVTSTRMVVHDYGSSVGQELLARRSDGSLSVTMTDMTLMNGGIYPELHRRTDKQSRFLDPVIGPVESAQYTEEAFVSDLAIIFAPGYDSLVDGEEMWRTYSRDEGHVNSYLLIRYIRDRETHRDRWVDAMERTDLPLQFVWGLQDPVAGAHIAERIRERMPEQRLLELPDVGHWPSLEAPERVIAAVLGES